MNTTFTMSNEGIETEGTTIELKSENANNTTKPSESKASCCKAKFLCITTFIFTVILIAGFGFIFGPLIVQRKLQVFPFNSSQITVQHYRLRLEPDLKVNEFHGRASIIFTNSQRTKDLRLCMHNLNIEHINITRRNQLNVTNSNDSNTISLDYHIWNVTSIKFKDINYEFENQKQISNLNQTIITGSHSSEAVIMLEKPLEIGHYMFDVYYIGKMGSSSLEKLQYKEDVNSNKTLLVLKEANRVFPSFGNHQKINFELSVARTTNVSCYTNVLLKETELIHDRNGYVWDHFRITPLILPSSLALIIADYKTFTISSDINRRAPVHLKIFAPKNYLPRLTYLADVLPSIFDYFQDYFIMKYPLSKLDLIIVDNQLMTSKLGLIMIDSTQVLLDVINDNLESRRNIFTVVSESVALQWLNYYLNGSENKEVIRGFGKFLGFCATKTMNEAEQEIAMQWNSEEMFVSNILEKSLDRFEYEHDYSDDTKIKKIASVLRMVNFTLSEKVFQSGINRYLSKSTDDFWSSAENLRLLGNFTGKQLLLSWLENDAYPVVTVTRTTGWNMLIEQESILPKHNKDIFVIPISYISRSNEKIQYFTLNSKQTVRNLFVRQEDWILLNYNRIGFYRVNYQSENWLQLIKQLEDQPAAISQINRAQLINDAFALADSNLLQYDIPFKIIRYLRVGNESNYLVWKAAIEALNRHEAVFLDSSKYGLFRKFKVNQLTELWNLRRSLDTNLLGLIQTELCRMQYKPCISEAMEIYERFQHRKDVFIPEWVYCTVVAHNYSAYEHVQGKLQANSDPMEMQLLFQSLTCSNEDWQIQSLLELSLSNKNHVKYIWPALSRTSLGRLSGLTFLECHWPDWMRLNVQVLQDTEEIFKIIIDEFLAKLSTPIDLNKIHELYMKSPHSLDNNFDLAMINVGRRIKWFKKNADNYISYLSNE